MNFEKNWNDTWENKLSLSANSMLAIGWPHEEPKTSRELLRKDPVMEKHEDQMKFHAHL